MIKNNKNIFTKIISDRRFIALIGLVIIALISFPLAKNVSQRYRADKEIKELEEEIKKIAEKNSELSRLVEYFGSEEYLEEEARLNFGLKKQGETAAVISQKDSAVISGENQSDETSSADNNFKRWRNYFFGEY